MFRNVFQFCHFVTPCFVQVNNWLTWLEEAESEDEDEEED